MIDSTGRRIVFLDEMKKDITVRKATLTDAAYIADIHVAAWNDTYNALIPTEALQSLTRDNSKNLWEKVLTPQVSAETQVYIAVLFDKIVGFISVLQKFESTDEAEILAFYILPSYQRRGIGQLLLHTVFEKAKTDNIQNIIVWALKSNNKAYSFYISQGAAVIGERKITISNSTLTETKYSFLPDALGIFGPRE